MIVYKRYSTKDFQINLKTNCLPLARAIDRYLDFPRSFGGRSAVKINLQIYEKSGVDPNEYGHFLHSPYAKEKGILSSALDLKFARVRIWPGKNLIEAELLRFMPEFKERIIDYVLMRPLRRLLLARGYYFMHAAAVKKGARTVIICGPSNCGKSTLSLALAQAGWGILADDDCFLEEKGGKLFIHPFPTKAGLKRRLPFLKIPKGGVSLHARKMRFSLGRLYSRDADAELKDVIIIFPVYSSAKNLKITALKNKDALERLMRENLAAFKSKNSSQEDSLANFWLLYALCKASRAFELRYNDRLLGTATLFGWGQLLFFILDLLDRKKVAVP